MRLAYRSTPVIRGTSTHNYRDFSLVYMTAVTGTPAVLDCVNSESLHAIASHYRVFADELDTYMLPNSGCA